LKRGEAGEFSGDVVAANADGDAEVAALVGEPFKLGARGLRSICESILTDAMFELPSSKQTVFHLNLEYAQKNFDKSKMSLLKVA